MIYTVHFTHGENEGTHILYFVGQATGIFMCAYFIISYKDKSLKLLFYLFENGWEFWQVPGTNYFYLIDLYINLP